MGAPSQPLLLLPTTLARPMHQALYPGTVSVQEGGFFCPKKHLVPIHLMVPHRQEQSPVKATIKVIHLTSFYGYAYTYSYRLRITSSDHQTKDRTRVSPGKVSFPQCDESVINVVRGEKSPLVKIHGKHAFVNSEEM